MPKVREVCHVVRSKVAGPFWVTMDLMFDSKDNYDRFVNAPALSPEAVGKVYGVDPATIKRFPVPDLKVLKISYPRQNAQGGVGERDLHSGQQYTYMMDVELA